MRRRLIWTALAIVCTVGAVVHIQTKAASPAPEKQVSSDISLLDVSSDAVEIEFLPPKGRGGLLETELYDLDGKLLAKVSRRHRGKPFKVTLYAQINKDDLANYYVRYRFDSNQDFRQRSLLFVGEILGACRGTC